jgi:hypothetical protein
LTFVCLDEYWHHPFDCSAGLLPVALSAGYKLLPDLLEAHCVDLVQNVKWLSKDALSNQRLANDNFDIGVSEYTLFN